MFAAGAVVDAATIAVTTLDDSGAGSLRQAVIDAMATGDADTITFSVDGTITLATQLPDIIPEGGALTIDGTGRAITIGGNGHRVILVNAGAELSLANLTLSGATSAAIYNSGRLTVSRSTFSNNQSSSGGAIYNNGVGQGPGQSTITNSSFSGNSASTSGGAVFNQAGTMTIVNSTFAGNTAGNGGGVGADLGGTVTTLTNTILFGNAGGNCGGTGPIANGGNNIDDGTTCGWGSAKGSLSSTNPQIDALALNAPGNTRTFALLAGSPAIDAGDAGACPATDQRGIGRPQGAACDIGAFEVVAVPAAANYQGLWWKPDESGWGINFAHQGDIVFATWFTYGVDNKPQWYVVRAQKTATNVYAGPVSSFTGPPFSSEPFPPNVNVRTQVGTATITFAADGRSAAFNYTVNGVTQTKEIVPQEFASPVPTCVWGAQPDLTLATNYQDLWWVTDGAESGWGTNFTHQGSVIFATWFTYDASGNAWWLFVVAAQTAVPNVYAGVLKTAVGPPFDADPFDPNAVVRTAVGNATITIIDGNHATFDYTVNGVTQSKSLTRQVFATPGTVCQ